MEEKAHSRWQPAVVDDHKRKRIRIALRQLEWAEIYLQSAASVDLADVPTRQAIHALRAQLGAATRRLSELD